MLMTKPEPLFNPIQNKKVIAFDLSGEKYERDLSNFKFRPGVYGVLRRGSKLLVQKHPGISKYGLPGGAVEMGETMTEALVREFEEETGLRVKLGKLITVFDDFFTHEGFDAHGILVFYEIIENGGELVHEGNQLDSSEVGFVDLDDLNEANVQRVFWAVIKELK